MSMERPAKIEVGQRWRVGDRDAKEITVTGFYAELNAWYVCRDGDPDVNDDDGSPYRHDGTCCWYSKEFFSNATFLGGPSPAVSTGRPKPAKGQRWRSRWAGMPDDGEIHVIDSVGTSQVLVLLPSGNKVKFDAEVWERTGPATDGPSRGWYEFVDHGEQPKVTAPVCKCGKACVSDTSGYACTAMHNSCATSAVFVCETAKTTEGYCGNALCAEHAQAATRSEAKSEPAATEPARVNKESIDPSIRKAAEAQRAKGPRIVGTYRGRDLGEEATVAHLMRKHGRYDNGSLLIDLEKPARVSAFTERFGKPTPSKRYKPSDDVDGDIPDAYEVWR